MQKQNYFYQSDFISSVIFWSYGFLLLTFGTIIWLEISTFQWITLLFYLAFILLVALVYWKKRLVIYRDQWHFKTFRKKKTRNFVAHEFKGVYSKGFSLTFVLNDEQEKSFSILVSRATMNVLIYALETQGVRVIQGSSTFKKGSIN